MTQVHKETLTQVENALPNRQGLDFEIFGMEGVPEDVMQAHQQRVLQQFYEQQAERRAATGNPPPGSTPTGGAPQPKKPKVETKEDLKARLAAHKAKKAQEAAGGSSGDVTPLGQGGQSPAVAQSPTAFVSAPSHSYCCQRSTQTLTESLHVARCSAVPPAADVVLEPSYQPGSSRLCAALRSARLLPVPGLQPPALPSAAWLWCSAVQP